MITQSPPRLVCPICASSLIVAQKDGTWVCQYHGGKFIEPRKISRQVYQPVGSWDSIVTRRAAVAPGTVENDIRSLWGQVRNCRDPEELLSLGRELMARELLLQEAREWASR